MTCSSRRQTTVFLSLSPTPSPPHPHPKTCFRYILGIIIFVDIPFLLLHQCCLHSWADCLYVCLNFAGLYFVELNSGESKAIQRKTLVIE